METGVITFNLGGDHFLHTFSGDYLIEPDAMAVCAVLVQKLIPRAEWENDANFVGKLARGRVDNKRVVWLEILTRGGRVYPGIPESECPPRSDLQAAINKYNSTWLDASD